MAGREVEACYVVLLFAGTDLYENALINYLKSMWKQMIDTAENKWSILLKTTFKIWKERNHKKYKQKQMEQAHE
jgi:hypothetical protein